MSDCPEFVTTPQNISAHIFTNVFLGLYHMIAFSYLVIWLSKLNASITLDTLIDIELKRSYLYSILLGLRLSPFLWMRSRDEI